MKFNFDREWHEDQRDMDADGEVSAGLPLEYTIGSTAPPRGVYQMYRDRQKRWRWRFMMPNGRIIATSNDSYSSKPDCELSIQLVRAGVEIVEESTS